MKVLFLVLLKVIGPWPFTKREMNRPSIKRNGKWREFNKHAILIAEGTYVSGVKQGQWREYYDSGELMISEHYHNGVPHGAYTSYHRNGFTMSEGTFLNGLREGEFRVYDESGRHIESIWFHRDEQQRRMSSQSPKHSLLTEDFTNQSYSSV